MATNVPSKSEIKEITEKNLNDINIPTKSDGMSSDDLKGYITTLEKKLIDAENEKLKSKVTLDGCVDAVVTVNAKNIITYWNPAAEKLWGYTSEETVGQPMYKYAPEGMRDQHTKGMDNYLKTGEKKVLGKGREVKILRKDGIEVAVLLTLSEAKLGSEIIFTAFIKDITEIKKQEFQLTQQMEEMRAQEEELRQNMEEMQTTQEELSRKMKEGEIMQQELDARINALNAAAILSEADTAGNIIFTNDKLSEISGYTREEMMGKPHNIFRHPDNPKSLYKEMWDTIKAGKIFQGTYPNKKKDGTDYWVDATIAPVLGDEGKPIKYVGIRFDVTKSKLQQLEMEKSRGELDARVNALNASAILSESDLYGNITFVNDKLCEISGYTRQEMLGKPHNIFRHPDNPKSLYKEMWDTIKAGKIFQGTYPNKKKDGTDYWVDATIALVMGEDGKPVKYVGIRFDVTKAKLQQFEMEKKEAEMTGLLNAINSTYAMIEFDPFGNILIANDIFLETTGYKLNELKGKHHRILCPQDYANSLEYKNFWESLRSGIMQKGNFKRVAKGGEDLWLDATYTPVVDIDGKALKVLKIATYNTAFTIGFQQATEFINQLKLGNFKAKMDFKGHTLTGEIAKVTGDLVDLKEVVETVLNEVNRVVNLAGNEGQLRE
ncbi:MAG: PAS domain-containing protein, partial [Cytophagales bacterium]